MAPIQSIHAGVVSSQYRLADRVWLTPAAVVWGLVKPRLWLLLCERLLDSCWQLVAPSLDPDDATRPELGLEEQQRCCSRGSSA